MPSMYVVVKDVGDAVRVAEAVVGDKSVTFEVVVPVKFTVAVLRVPVSHPLNVPE